MNNNDRKNHSYFAGDEYIDEPVYGHTLSISKDSLQNRTVDIYVSLTNTHWREYSVITVTPKNVDKKRIKARYFSH